jgi:hypothetical protein
MFSLNIARKEKYRQKVLPMWADSECDPQDL